MNIFAELDNQNLKQKKVESYGSLSGRRKSKLNNRLTTNTIKYNILNMICQSKYFSIILDYTPDMSYIEQITIITRFVLLNEINIK